MNHHRRFLSIALLVLLVFPTFAYPSHLYNEAHYRDLWCYDHNGTIEYRLPDGTVADCMTAKHAIEFEFADNWYESVAQSLHYAMMSNHKAGIVMIVEKSSDLKYWNRLVALKKYYKLPLTLWKISP